jgi:PAS domain-containing protein
VHLRLKYPDGKSLVIETCLEIQSLENRRLLSGRAWDITARADEETRQKELLGQLAESQNCLVERRTRLQQTTKELDLFNRLAQAFLSHTSSRDLFALLESILSRAFHGAGSSVDLVDDAMVTCRGLHFPGKPNGENRSFDVSQRVTAGAIDSRPVAVVSGLHTLPGTVLKVHGLIAVAIRHGDEVLGQIWLGGAKGGFQSDATGLLERVAGQLAPILRSDLAERRLLAVREHTLAVALADEAKITLIFRNSVDALFPVDAETERMVNSNRQAAMLLADGDPQRLIGLEGRCLRAEPPSAAEAAALRQRIAEGFEYESEFEYRGLGGRVFWGHVAGVQPKIPGARRQLFGIVDIIRRTLAERLAGQEARFRREIMDSVAAAGLRQGSGRALPGGEPRSDRVSWHVPGAGAGEDRGRGVSRKRGRRIPAPGRGDVPS